MRILIVVVTKDTLAPRCLEGLLREMNSYHNADLMIHVSRPAHTSHTKMVNLCRNCSENRNRARAAALGTKADAFLFVDSDVVLPESALGKLSIWEKPVVGGYCPIDEKSFAAGIFSKDVFFRIGNPRPQGLVNVDMAGLGCALVRRDVLEKISFRHGCNEFCKAFSTDNPITMPIGESLAFATDCKSAGFSEFMDGDVLCEHLK